MSEHEAEELELESSDLDADPTTEIEILAREGYVEQACTTEGTVLWNPKTKQHKLVRV